MTDEIPTDPWSMTPEQATQKLNEMSAAYNRGPEPPANPTTPAEARAKLDALKQDKQWADDLMAGGIEARREFLSLTEMAASADVRLDSVLNGTATPQMMELTSPEHPHTTAQLQSAVADFREAGIDDNIIREILSDRVVPKAEHEAVKALQTKLKGNAEWVKKLLSGDYEAKQQLTLMSAVLSMPVADE